MSGALTALASISGVAQQALPQVLGAAGLANTLAFIRQPRQIGPANKDYTGSASTSGGTIIPDVTIEENFSDRLSVTEHPIATGVPLTDHAFRYPRTVVMKLGFTNANPVGAVVGGIVSGLTASEGDLGAGLLAGGKGLLSSLGETRAKDFYDKLVRLQYDDKAQSGRPAVVPFQLTTGKRTYPAMVIKELTVRNDARTEYALIVDVHFQEVITASATSSPQPSQASQSMPQKTDGTSQGGTKSPAQSEPWWVRQNQEIFGPILGNTPARP
jgi:hypothetical protein